MFLGIIVPKEWKNHIITEANFIRVFQTGENSVAIARIMCQLAYFYTEKNLEGSVTYSR